MLKKNQIVRFIITDITADGNGVGHYDNMAVFVPMTAVGDDVSVKIVKVNKNYAYGIIDSILSPSEDRIPPDCNVFGRCGGCTFRHISYDAELEIKNNIVKNAFIRIGGLNPVFEDIVPCENRDFYRNKVQFPVTELNGQAVCGFYSKRSHRVVPFTSCKLQNSIFKNITSDIICFINENKIPAYNEENHNGIVRHIYLRCGYYSGEIMVCIVVKKDISEQLRLMSIMLEKKYKCIKSIVMNINPDNTNVILGRKNIIIKGNSVITDIMCGNKIEISPHSFYQVNTHQAEKLYKIAENFANLKGNELLLDLYCGTGTIGLSMADKVKKIIGVEIIPQAIENAEKNAQLNNISNAEFICGDASNIACRLSRNNISPDVIILDPPRKGCDILTIESVVKMLPERIVMISCNPATAARDCKIFNSMNYKTFKVCAVDMFANTGHVETVCLMSRKDK
jgi:23S rRNA (uracil1939-C5)-methyltransferase